MHEFHWNLEAININHVDMFKAIFTNIYSISFLLCHFIYHVTCISFVIEQNCIQAIPVDYGTFFSQEISYWLSWSSGYER